MRNSTKPTEVAILTNFIPPTRLPAFQAISNRFQATFFVDTAMEDNRQWAVENEGLDVRIVWGVSVPISYRHPQGFRDSSYLHLPCGLLGALLAAKPERVISGELGLRTGIACLYKMLRPSIRLVVWTEGTPHTDGPRGVLRKWWRRMIAQIPDRFVAVSSGAKTLLESYGVPEDRVQLSYFVSGFYPPPQVPVRDPCQRRRLLHSGSLNERKGIRGFVDVLASIAQALDHPVELWFAGTGPEESYLRSMPLPHGLTFRFLGFVPFEQMPDVYRQCGILVFPTLADVWGLVTNEAMMYGMPVLGSRYAGSVCDLITDYETGWTFTPDNRMEMERAIRIALSTNAEELEEMGMAARRRAEKLTPEAFADSLVDALFQT
jgi:glycosyltransferase involved in cell wall biosynthesis